MLVNYIDELSVTGLTANPTILDHAIKNSASYDAAIREKLKEGKSGGQCRRIPEEISVGANPLSASQRNLLHKGDPE